MDGFVVDLDKVLDEFEESEDTVLGPRTPPSSNFACAPPSYRDVEQRDSSQTGSLTQCNKMYFNEEKAPAIQNSPHLEATTFQNAPSDGMFDLQYGAGIDHNIHRLQQISIKDQNGDEGHFIPDDSGHDVVDSPYGYDPGIYSAHAMGLNEHLYDSPNSQEILQAASELQAHISGKEDRPSFMSSSPPLSQFHHPDVIPSSCSTDSSQASNENQSDSGVSSEQGETGIPNTSPVHRSNPVDASDVLHSLEDIAQNSYTVPAAVSDNAYQLSTDTNVNRNNLDVSVSEKENSIGSQRSELSGAGDTDTALSQLLPSNTAEQEFNVKPDNDPGSPDISVGDQQHVTVQNSLPDSSTLSNSDTARNIPETLPQTPACNEQVSTLQEIESLQQAAENKILTVSEDINEQSESSALNSVSVIPTVSSNTNEDVVTSLPSDCSITSNLDSSEANVSPVVKDSLRSQGDENTAASSLPPNITEQCDQSYQNNVSCDSVELPVQTNAAEETDHSEKLAQLTPEKQPNASAILDKQDTCKRLTNSQPTSDEQLTLILSNKTTEVCDVKDTGTLEKFSSSEFPLNEEDYASAMSQAESELAELEREIANMKDQGVVIEPENFIQNNSEVDVNLKRETAIHDDPTDVFTPTNDNPTSQLSTSQISTETVSVSTAQVSNISSPSSTLTSPVSPEASVDGLKRRDSGESVERFLAPSVMSPGIATPMDDPGFTKVPGYLPALDSMTEEDEQSKANASSVNIGASLDGDKPNNESTPERARKSRPNSLLGLSKPDLPPAKVLDHNIEQPTDGSSVNPLYEASVTGTNSNVNPVATDMSVSQPFAQEVRSVNTDLHLARPSGLQDINQAHFGNESILRPKTFAPPQNLPGIESRNLAQPDSLNLAFPASNVQPQRPMSWPVQGTTQDSQKQRRPNSLNIPSRGGSVSPSQPMPPSFIAAERSVPYAAETSPVAVETPCAVGKTVTGVDSATEAIEGAMAADVPSAHQEVSSSSASGDSLITIPTVTSPGRTPGTALPPQSSSNPLLSITDLGKIAPTWVPDADAPNCMQCDIKFTFTKRRHHCRACGKVFCSSCCYLKYKLQYMESKEARVCSKCYQDLIRAVVFERMSSTEGAVGGGTSAPSPNPNNPSEYCSTIPPLQQAQASLNAPPPSVMVPVGVLRKEGSLKRESKQVIFSDGIRPGGDLTELDGSSEIAHPPPRPRRVRRVGGSSDSQSSKAKTRSMKPTQAPSVSTCYVPQAGLPPVFNGVGSKGEFLVEQNGSVESIMAQIRTGDDPVQFVVNKNLLVLVKLVTLDCCVHKTCWCFTSKGMCTVGQDEIVIVLECFPDEECLPVDIFQHFHRVYEDASKGEPVSNMDHSIYTQGFLDSRDHGGFLYLRPSFQCLNKLIIPEAPYVFGVLLQKWETPWAKVFPVRLLLRLGAEFRYYPCPLVSVRFRKPVFGEIGHTIMNLLVDFRNFQYMIPHVRGFTIYMKDKKSYLNLPRNRYDDVTRALSSSTEQVLALAANFSKDADSYLVCIQNDDGNYQTQAINIHNKPREVTGASFVVFNANLKTSGGVHAKSSIVEDGIMVQILPETMMQLRSALKDMRDYCIEYGGTNPNEPEETVVIQWVDNDKDFNVGVFSPIDKFPMDGVTDVHIHNAIDYVGDSNKAVRWTQVFFLQTNAENARIEPVDLSRLAETLSSALSVALTPKLDRLAEAGLFRIGLRARIDNENVGYEVGSNGEKLPDFYMNDLDNELIPVIHNAAAHNRDGSVILELIFHIINI